MATGRHELPAHAAFLDPVAFQNTLYRSPIVPHGQPRHHALLHRSLQLSVLLQLTVALQFHFLALARSDPRPFQRNLLPTKNQVGSTTGSRNDKKEEFVWSAPLG